jgi:glycosyltransferase involved in cell wall biosynthesis
MDKLNILIFNWRDIRNPEAGGAEVFTHENAKRWVKMGNEVTLFTSEYPNCEEEEVLDGVRIVRSGGKYTVYGRAKKYYKQRFSREGYDIIVDEINTRPFLTPRFVDKNKIIALIHQLAREYWFYEIPFPISYLGYYFLEERWLRNYVNIPTVTVSESTKQDLLHLRFKDVSVVPEGLNFTPLNKIPEKEPYPVVVYVGRLRRAKRPDHAIKAFTIVKEQIPKAKLWIIGDGYFRKHLETIATDGMTFFGYVPGSKKLTLMKRAWVLVNPSVREGFGLNVVEANALGTPCVAYDVAGLRDSVKNDETGLLARAGSIKDLAEKIIMILKHKIFRLSLSRNALIYSRLFTWDNSAEAFLKAIRCVLDDR